uniref:SWIM-type domain-containing protein n=1 Tax=Rhipicephalus zambeziensis TaxID=60191 RepID=A0A224Y8I6_9ACAR
MSQILFAGFRPIKEIGDYFHGAASKSGDKLHTASHVRDVKEVDGLDVHAKCRSQQGKQLYEVILHLDKDSRQLRGGYCSCRYGAAGTCKHCTAVALYITRHEDVSCTTQRQKWGQPSKVQSDDKASIEELFGNGIWSEKQEYHPLLHTPS